MSERERNRERNHERNHGVDVRLWKREGIILPGFAGTIARWRQRQRQRNRPTEEGDR